mgnify:CR=1 FL=1
MKKIVLIVLVLAVAALASGCASYNPKTGIPDVKTFQETEIKVVNPEAGITIVAYPIQTKEDAELYFDNTSLAKDGVLPVYVSFSMGDIGNKNYRVDTVFLQTEIRSIPTISAEVAYKLIKKSYGGKMAAWGIWTYGVGAPISAAHTASVNSKTEKDLKEKGMNDTGEIKKEGVSGFLYFKIPDNLESLDNSFLVFVLTDKDSRNLTVKFPLKGMITAR